MNKQNELALTDEQLDTISGGCYSPSYKSRRCDDYKKDYDRCDYDRDYDKHDRCGHHRNYCD